MSFFTDGVWVPDPNSPHGYLFDSTQATQIIDPTGAHTQSYTVECWFKRTSSATYQARLFSFDGYSQGRDLCFTWDSANTIVDVNGSAALQTGTIGDAVDGNWHHLAIVYNSSVPNIKLFYDGIERASSNGTYGVPGSGVLYGLNVGGEATNTYNTTPFTGKITNFRVVIGTAVYTSNFTVPTSPLSNITGTTLLLQPNSSKTAIVDRSNNAFVPISTAGTSYDTDTPFLTQLPDYVSIYERPVAELTQIRYNWTSNNTSDATSYIVSCTPTDGGSGGGSVLLSSSQFVTIFPGLSFGKFYTGAINASNDAGIGLSTMYLNVSTGNVPEPPQSITHTVSGGDITFSWSPPTNPQIPAIGWYVIDDSNAQENFNTLYTVTTITIPFNGSPNNYFFRSVGDTGYSQSTIVTVT